MTPSLLNRGCDSELRVRKIQTAAFHCCQYSEWFVLQVQSADLASLGHFLKCTVEAGRSSADKCSDSMGPKARGLLCVMGLKRQSQNVRIW